MGTPEFARKPLSRLYDDGFDIAGVFTQADKPRDRGMKVSFSPVKELALERGTNIFQPATLRDGTAEWILKELGCELIAVVAYGKLLPKEILDLPPLGCINIHGSLLPKYRGAAPIQHAILNGETETGVTSMYMSEGMDEGDILYTKKLTIEENETAAQLYDRLSSLSADLLSETLDAISRGTAKRLPQNHKEATFAPLLTKEFSPINWMEQALRIKNKVRGLIPWPVATMELDGKAFKVFSVDITNGNTGKSPGEIVSAGKHGLEVACADGTVIIKELQAPGGKRMAAADYLRGNPL
jgi:methionyl-tRNA formyltransferase